MFSESKITFNFELLNEYTSEFSNSIILLALGELLKYIKGECRSKIILKCIEKNISMRENETVAL